MTNQGETGLWTRDFTIITLGSVVSMVGGAMSAFAVSVMVLDYTNSTFLYALFNVCFQLPMLAAPLLAGPILDRVSRKQVIYRLDYLTSGLYLALYTSWIFSTTQTVETSRWASAQIGQMSVSLILWHT